MARGWGVAPHLSLKKYMSANEPPICLQMRHLCRQKKGRKGKKEKKGRERIREKRNVKRKKKEKKKKEEERRESRKPMPVNCFS